MAPVHFLRLLQGAFLCGVTNIAFSLYIYFWFFPSRFCEANTIAYFAHYRATSAWYIINVQLCLCSLLP